MQISIQRQSNWPNVLNGLGSAVLYAKSLGNLGVCYAHLGDYDTAIRYYEEAAQRSRASGNLRDQQIWLGGIATAELDRLEPKEALTAIAQSITGHARNPDSAALFRIMATEAQRFPELAVKMRDGAKRRGTGARADYD